MKEQREQLSEQHRKVRAEYVRRSRDNPYYFVRGLTIPGARGPAVFDEVMADFQREAFQALAPSLIAVRDGTMPPTRWFWIERTKKASKDNDLGASTLWPLVFPARPLYMQVGAADKDQAAIIKRRINEILYYNPWLNEYVEVNNYKVRSKVLANCELDILAADIPGSHGETPQLLLLNELSHVTRWEFVENLLDNATGVPQAVVILATNAGFEGSKAEQLRKCAQLGTSLNDAVSKDRKQQQRALGVAEQLIQLAGTGGALSQGTKKVAEKDAQSTEQGIGQGTGQTDTGQTDDGQTSTEQTSTGQGTRRWYVQIINYPAPWLTEDDLLEAEQRNTKSRFLRLFRGQWSSGKGDAFNRDTILRLFSTHVTPLEKPEPGWRQVAGLDLGINRDHCGLAIAAVSPALRKIRLAYMRGFAPPGDGVEIDLMNVEEHTLIHCRRLAVESLWYDPAQAVLMAQRLRSKGINCRQQLFVGANLTRMAETLKQVAENGVLELYDDEEGRMWRDIGKLCIVEKTYGYKLEATKDEFGHADVGTALVCLLPRAVQLLDPNCSLWTDDLEVAAVANVELTEEEQADMPDELRDIIDAYDDRQRGSRGRSWDSLHNQPDE